MPTIGKGIQVFTGTTSVPGVAGADNGLSINGANVELGGDLIQNTDIHLKGHNLRFLTSDNFPQLLTIEFNQDAVFIHGNEPFSSQYISCFISDTYFNVVHTNHGTTPQIQTTIYNDANGFYARASEIVPTSYIKGDLEINLLTTLMQLAQEVTPGVYNYSQFIGKFDSAGKVFALMGVLNPGLFQGFQTGNNATGFNKGIVMEDQIDQVGLYYAADYSAQGVAIAGDRFIPDLGYIKTLSSGTKIPVKTTLSVTTNLIVFNTGATNSVYRVSCSLFANIGGGGSAQISITFTDQDFTVQTINLTPVLLATGNAYYQPVTILCTLGTTISVDVVIVPGGVNASAGGLIELLASE